MSRASRLSTGRSRGFTLLEAVITLLLVSVVFGLAADILGDACRVMTFSRAKSNSIQAIQQGLARIAAEAREAFQIDGTGDELVLLKVDPSVDRFTGPAVWNPYAAQLRVRYYVAGGQLLREVDGAGGQLVADGVSGLACAVRPGGSLEVSLSLLEDRVVRTLSLRVRTPAVVGP